MIYEEAGSDDEAPPLDKFQVGAAQWSLKPEIGDNASCYGEQCRELDTQCGKLSNSNSP